jgi:competence protein ComEC
MFGVLIFPILILFTLELSAYLTGIKRSKWIENIFWIGLIYSGSFLHFINSDLQQKSVYDQMHRFVHRPSQFLLRLDEPPEKRYRTTKVMGHLCSIKSQGDTFFQREVKMILYLDTTVDVEHWTYGSLISVAGTLSYPLPPLNPGEFDYRKWLLRKHIYLTSYSRSAMEIGHDSSLWMQLRFVPMQIRDFFEGQLSKYIVDSGALNIAKSILIGVRTDIDDEVISAYSSTGTIHILSVSGLHFSILMAMLSFFMNRLPRRFRGVAFVFKTIFSFVYALMTGFSPPVIRSFLMFFVYDLSELVRGKKNTFNVLFFAAFFILLFNTYQLFDVGYILSFAAILGIFILNTPIYRKVQFEHRISIWLWKSTTALFSAWLFTVPFTVYYFHKISLLSMLCNYLVIPISEAILVLGYGLMALSWWSIIANPIGKLVEWLILLQNKIIFFFEAIPLGRIDSLFISTFQLILIVLILGLCIYWWMAKRRYILVVILLLCIVCDSSILWDRWKAKNESEWVLFNLRKKTAFGFREGSRFYLFADSLDQSSIGFSIEPYLISKFVDSLVMKPLLVEMNKPKKYSISPDDGQYLVLCRENKPFWKYFATLDRTFILSRNMGNFYQNRYDSILVSQKKRFIKQTDTTFAIINK